MNDLPDPFASRALLSRPIHHISFIVDDVPSAVASWVSLYGAGPFFLLEHMVMEHLESPLGPAVFDHSSAFGIWGDTAVELQTIHDIAPAQLSSAFSVGTPRLNHVAYVVADHIAESERLVELGLPRLLRTRTGPAESSFHDAPALGHVIEIQQDAEFIREFFAGMREEAAHWDGSDPLRVVDLSS